MKAEDAPIAGAGALLSDRHVLTCAHVVNAALRKDPMDVESPTPSARLFVVVRQGTESHRSAARPVVWVPPRLSPGSNWGEGDLAVLELDEPAAPSMRAVIWQDMTEGLKARAYHGGGETGTFANTTIEVADAWYYYADANLKGASIQPGYSGGPLFRRDDPTVAAGLVTHHVINERLVSDTQVMRRTLTVPWQRIRAELDRWEAQDVINALPGPLADTGNVPDGVVDLLGELFDSSEELKYQANRLARKLGFHMTAETPETAVLQLEEELAALLFTEGRALATWAALLTEKMGKDRRKKLNRLVALGRTKNVRLLSVGEHQRFLALLISVNAVHPRLLCQAARQVLQLADSLPAWVSDGAVPEAELAAAVDELDRDGPAMVPPLVRLAVFLSAAVTDKAIRKQLDDWCDDVRRRLGRDSSLLADCREQASEWARLRRRPVARIVVDLSRNDEVGERYICHFWRVREGRAPEATGISAGPYTAEEIGRQIHGLAGEPEDGAFPRIDLVVGKQHLDVPFDGWTAATMADEFAQFGVSSPVLEGRLMLGAQYQVTLRLREYWSETEKEDDRRAMLKRRWESGRTDPFVVKDDKDPRVVAREMRAEHSDASWAVLHGDRKRREWLLSACLALGFPVVLWDREASHAEHAQRLDNIVGSVAFSELPEAVRRFREDVYYAARTDAARPAMLWDDPGTVLPTPQPDYDDPPDALTNSGRMAAR